jgi:hypothetical protein
MQTRSKIILSAIVIVLVVVVGLKVLFPAKIPDDVQIQNQISTAVDAANSKNARGITSIISDDYQDNEANNAYRMKTLLGQAMSNIPQIQVTTSPAKTIVTGSNAVSTDYITVNVDGGIAFSQFVKLHWQKEPTHRLLFIPDQTWRVVDADYDINSQAN